MDISTGNAHPPSRFCPPHLRPCLPYRYRTLNIYASSSGMSASYAISVRQASALPAAYFRFHLTVDTLAIRLTVSPVGPVEDFHFQMCAPLPGAHKKRRPLRTADVSFNRLLISCWFIVTQRLWAKHPQNWLSAQKRQNTRRKGCWKSRHLSLCFSSYDKSFFEIWYTFHFLTFTILFDVRRNRIISNLHKIFVLIRTKACQVAVHPLQNNHENFVEVYDNRWLW